MTFMICIFILLMQFLWMHVKDLVGKGVGISVLAEFFVYSTISVVPLALPLAILLASLMTFGNMGEKFELTAMKSAGISLFRIMRPLTICIAFICVGAFFFSNYVMPKSQVKLWTLIFSLRQKSPELEIPAGEFYDGINGYNIYVRHKDTKTGLLEDLMIYDFSNGFRNTKVMVADSGRLYFTADNKYLMLCLYHGESFENLTQQQSAISDKDRIPYRRETFARKQLLIDFDSEFSRYDESVLRDQHVSKNAGELVHSIDSVKLIAHSRSRGQSREMVNNRYFGRERVSERQLAQITKKEQQTHSIDSLRTTLPQASKERAATIAYEKARAASDQVEYNALLLDDSQRYIRKHAIELHRKFTLSFACLIFFFIGAPLGAIIRKG
ncbi:MAG TPA: YjgP/YjgQ family permease, partial [Bacteroidales bacterium]|nr:YjgP/YjgQ family permease [Bacteroidales bacterium]